MYRRILFSLCFGVLAMGLTGADAEPTSVSLRALPTVSTPIGPIDYPSPITVVSHTVGTR